MLEKIVAEMVGQGVVGMILAFFMYLLYQMIQKLFKVIETNTKAWTNAHEKLDTIVKKQNERREKFT